jgi:hypothetical protein
MVSLQSSYSSLAMSQLSYSRRDFGPLGATTASCNGMAGWAETGYRTAMIAAYPTLVRR